MTLPMRLSELDSSRLLPPALRTRELVALLAALDRQWRLVAEALPMMPLLATIAEQPSDVVDALAYQLHVDAYDPTLPLDTRRALVAQSLRVHRLAGTRQAMQELLDLVWGGGAVLAEWFETEPPLPPGYFRITLTGALRSVDLTRFLATLRAVKRASDWPIISANTQHTLPVGLGVGQLQAAQTRGYEV